MTDKEIKDFIHALELKKDILYRDFLKHADAINQKIYELQEKCTHSNAIGWGWCNNCGKDWR